LHQFLPTSQFCFCFQKLIHNTHYFIIPTVYDFMSTYILKTSTFIHSSTQYVWYNVSAPGQWHKQNTRVQISCDWYLECVCCVTLSNTSEASLNNSILYIICVTENSHKVTLQLPGRLVLLGGGM
jgi:hypothetical protein